MKLMRNPNAKHIDFYEFKGLIESNPKICPSNLDMVFERRSKFLVCEWKREGEFMSFGQEILLKGLASQPNFIVLIVYGDTDEETKVLKFEHINKNGKFKQLGSGLDELQSFVRRWYRWADLGGKNETRTHGNRRDTRLG